jgi:hypothetical protein
MVERNSTTQEELAQAQPLEDLYNSIVRLNEAALDRMENGISP